MNYGGFLYVQKSYIVILHYTYFRYLTLEQIELQWSTLLW